MNKKNVAKQNSTLSSRLRELRELLGFTQRELAKEFGVTCGAIAHWENNNRPIPGPIIKLIDLYEKKAVRKILQLS